MQEHHKLEIHDQIAKITSSSELSNGKAYKSSVYGDLVELSRDIYRNLSSITKAKYLKCKSGKEETRYDEFITQMCLLNYFTITGNCFEAECYEDDYGDGGNRISRSNPLDGQVISPLDWFDGPSNDRCDVITIPGIGVITCQDLHDHMDHDIIAIDIYLGKLGVTEEYPVQRDYFDSKFLTLKEIED